jgi:signal transduction protein with GAF and PtsI domain
MQNVVRAEAYYKVFEEIVALVHSSTNVREVLDIIVWKVSEILQAKGAILRVVNLEKNELELGAAYGLSEQYLSLEELFRSAGIHRIGDSAFQPFHPP